MNIDHTTALRSLVVAVVNTAPGSPERKRVMDRIDAELAALRRIERGYAELVAEAREQELLAEPAAGRA